MSNENKKHKNMSLNNIRPQTDIRQYERGKKIIGNKKKCSTEDNEIVYHRISNASCRNYLNNIVINSYEKDRGNNNKSNNNIIKKPRITSKRVKKIKMNEGIHNLNDYIKFKDFHSNLIEGLGKMSPKSNNDNDNIKFDKKKCYNKINMNQKKNSNNNIIEAKRSKSNNNQPKLKQNLFNNVYNLDNKEELLNSLNNNNKISPALINIDLTKVEEKKNKNKNKNKSPIKKKAIKNKKNKSPKIKKVPSININLNEIEKKDEVKNLKKANNNINKNKNDIINANNINNITHNINNNNNINVNNGQKLEEKKEQINKIKKNNNNGHLFKSYYFCEYPNKEYREAMEDFHDYKNLSFNNFTCHYFAIFDGHNGKQVSLYLKENFHKILFNELKIISFTNDFKENNKKIILAIKQSFEIIDKNIINNKNIKDDVGSTGTIFLLYKDSFDNSKKILISANVGDSKGFIINKEKSKQITKDHNCKDANEVDRIKKKGGVVFQGRVFGTLILTRSLGDKEMKQYGVSSIPHCFSQLMNENDLYAVIGSDGAWDVLPNDILFELSREKMDSKHFAEKIIKLSIEKGSVDNISCLVIKLN